MMESASQVQSGMRAYTNALNAAKSGVSSGISDRVDIGGTGGGVTGGGFEAMLTGLLKSAADSGQKAEKVSLDALARKASPVDMVTSITQAELSLQTLVAVRDKVINAYQEIFKMPI